MRRFTAKTLSGLAAALPVFFTTHYRWNGRGHDDYRLGDGWTLNAGLSYPLTSRLAALGQVNAFVRGRDGQGKTHEEVGKTGGEFVYAAPRPQFELAPGVFAAALAQLPLYRRVNQIQLTYAAAYWFTLFHKFHRN
jgi:hypothetical protein